MKKHKLFMDGKWAGALLTDAVASNEKFIKVIGKSLKNGKPKTIILNRKKFIIEVAKLLNMKEASNLAAQLNDCMKKISKNHFENWDELQNILADCQQKKIKLIPFKADKNSHHSVEIKNIKNEISLVQKEKEKIIGFGSYDYAAALRNYEEKLLNRLNREYSKIQFGNENCFNVISENTIFYVLPEDEIIYWKMKTFCNPCPSAPTSTATISTSKKLRK